MGIPQILKQNKINFNQIGLVPIWLIILYIIGVILDAFTTYLATPDLKYEDNFLVKDLKLSWFGLITIGIITVILISIYFMSSIKYLKSPYIKKNNLIKCGLSYLIIIVFFYHFLYSYFISINNSLSYFYLRKIPGVFFNISEYYISLIKCIPKYYYLLKIYIALVSINISIDFIRILKKTFSYDYKL